MASISYAQRHKDKDTLLFLFFSFKCIRDEKAVLCCDTHLCARDIVDLCGQRLGQRFGEEAFGSLNAEVNDLSI